MIYDHMEIHNVGTLTELPEGGVTWLRFPEQVHNVLSDFGKDQNTNSTGVEIRFVLRGESATLRLARLTPGTRSRHLFHVYYGDIQGGWDCHEYDKTLDGDVCDFVIKRPQNRDYLHRVAKAIGSTFDPDVVRVIFDGGTYRVIGITGDVVPPEKSQCPSETILFYGSSITHGSNAIDMSHSFAYEVAHALRADVRNLGFAGACRMEPEVAEYLAKEGEMGLWTTAVCELGANTLLWDAEQIKTTTTHFIRTVAGRNPEKAVYIVSPFYCNIDFNGEPHAARWRTELEKVVRSLALPNVTYINGLDLLGDVSLISADEVHPNIYGVQAIADGLIRRMRR